MKVTKLDQTGVFEPLKVRSGGVEFSLPPEAVNVRSNGVEFLSPEPLPVWSELTLELSSPSDQQSIHCNGIVVSSNGSKHSGFVVSILFLGLDALAQSQIEALARDQRLSL